jgi:hypothetical protein
MSGSGRQCFEQGMHLIYRQNDDTLTHPSAAAISMPSTHLYALSAVTSALSVGSAGSQKDEDNNIAKFTFELLDVSPIAGNTARPLDQAASSHLLSTSY